MTKYKYIFFDLDRTLWDFERNMHDTMHDLFNCFLLNQIDSTVSSFIKTFESEHDKLWELYRNGRINKEKLRKERFNRTLIKLGREDKNLANTLNKNYLEICPAKKNLIPYSREILDYLYQDYQLFILTNGFIKTQNRKLENCGIHNYFNQVFSSEEIGYNKPHKKIFAWAVNSLNARKSECIMIGDDPVVDIKGAKKYGIDQVYFNPEKKPSASNATYEIVSLKELMNIF